MATRNPRFQSREILVVDNRPIRRRYFLEAQKILQKVERLEEKIRLFHSSDQKLFDQWSDLTFREHREAQAKAQNKYEELARFHNWIIATAHKLDIELSTAYVLMREEQIRWDQGDEKERQRIEEARQQREAFIQQEMRQSYNERYSYEEEEELDPKEGGIEGLGEILDQIEEVVLDGKPEPELYAEERIARLTALSDEQLFRALQNREVSFMLFDVSLNWGQKHQDYTLFKKIWHLMTEQQKFFFANVFYSVTEMPIEEFLAEIGLSPDWTSDSEEEDESEAFHFDEDFSESHPRGDPRAQKRPPVNEEGLKQTFRKLMRKLHPDMHNRGEVPPWVQRLWGRVQKAYNDKNAEALERLLKLTLIRLEALEELSVSEISDARQWLTQDLKALEEESAEMKRSYAWGFSRKKTYDSLIKKIEKEFQMELQRVLAQIEDLERQHEMLEMLSRHPERRSRGRGSGSRRSKY